MSDPGLLLWEAVEAILLERLGDGAGLRISVGSATPVFTDIGSRAFCESRSRCSCISKAALSQSRLKNLGRLRNPGFYRCPIPGALLLSEAVAAILPERL